jgi:hypothetical protein
MTYLFVHAHCTGPALGRVIVADLLVWLLLWRTLSLFAVFHTTCAKQVIDS